MKKQTIKESRERAKKKYYSETQFRSVHRIYTRSEEALILSKSMPDRELADLLNVSVKSIHNKRARLNQKNQFGAEIW